MEVNENLERLMRPKSIAIVGLSSELGPRHASVARMLEDGREIYLINPNRPSIMGIDTYPSLTAVGKSVDAVVSLISAEPATQLVEEAATLGVGGAVVIAAGFADWGPSGLELQHRLAGAARSAGMALVGPNCLGYANIRSGVSLARRISDLDVPGGVSVVSQSGSILHAVVESIQAHRYLGLSALLSVGNEAVTDLADYVNFLARDPDTDAIVLGIETVRRPKEFFEAVQLASAQGKVIVAIKLARSARSRQMAASHTGSLAGDAWVYDVALSQAGVIIAKDHDEAVDRIQFLAQIPQKDWTPVKNVGIISGAGGISSLAVDLATEEDVTLPAMEHFVPWLQERIRGSSVANPLDVPELWMGSWAEIVAKYEADPELDALVFFHILADEDKDINMGMTALKTFTEAAERSPKPFVLSTFAWGLPAEWVDTIRGDAVIGRGVRSTLRGLHSMGEVVAFRAKGVARIPVEPIERMDCDYVTTAEGQMLPFADAMALISGVGIPTAPYEIVVPDAKLDGIELPFGAPYVVKLADVAHRTELGVVRTNVTDDGLAEVIAELRKVAAQHGLPSNVAIQPQVASSGEVFVGIQITELGPLVVFGLGGIFVNVLKRVGGRMAPFNIEGARSLLEEFADLEIVHGFRGLPGWDLDQLADILVAAGRLAAGGADWIDSIDINPLINGPNGFAAVDALCLVK